MYKNFKYLNNFYEMHDELIEFISESIISYKEDFVNLLKEIDDPISKDILNISGKDIDTRNNFFGLSKDKSDTLTFISDRKYQDLMNRNFYNIRNIEYSIPSGNITKHPTIKNIWNELKLEPFDLSKMEINGNIVGYLSKNGNNYDTVVTSEKSGRSYVAFNPVDKKIPPFPVDINSVVNNNDYKKIELENMKQETRIGRGIKSLLISVGINKTDKEIEQFVNKFKSAYDISKDIFRFFQIVEGEDIKKYYSVDSYFSESGTLGQSCMRYKKCQDFLNFYTENPEKIKLVILKSKEDKSKIKGRALLWYLDDGKIFMDRIYTIKDSDIDLFKQYALKNKWWHRVKQTYGYGEFISSDGKNENNPLFVMKLKDINYKFFPYMDTMQFYFYEKRTLSNMDDYMPNEPCVFLNTTEGNYTWLRRCKTCNGLTFLKCQKCNGRGVIKCIECKGTGIHICKNCSDTVKEFYDKGELKVGEYIITNAYYDSIGSTIAGEVINIKNSGTTVIDTGDKRNPVKYEFFTGNEKAWIQKIHMAKLDLSEYKNISLIEKGKPCNSIKHTEYKVGKIIMVEDGNITVTGVICKIRSYSFWIAQNDFKGDYVIETSLMGFKYSWIVNISDSHKTIILGDSGLDCSLNKINCNYCKGLHSEICKECRGSGNIKCDACDGKNKPCPDCEKWGMIRKK